MEYTREKFFEVMYNTKLDKLVIKKERWISKIRRVIKTHKFITTVSIATNALTIATIISVLIVNQLLITISGNDFIVSQTVKNKIAHELIPFSSWWFKSLRNYLFVKKVWFSKVFKKTIGVYKFK